jgi:hypothetical protein
VLVPSAPAPANNGLKTSLATFPGLQATSQAARWPTIGVKGATALSGVSTNGRGARPGMSVHAPAAASPVGPAVPLTPLPSAPLLAGSAGGGSGFFFFVTALMALAGLLVPRFIGTVRTIVGGPPPQPFLWLLERPG